MHPLDPSQIRQWFARANIDDAGLIAGAVRGWTRKECGTVWGIEAAKTMFFARAIDTRLWVAEPANCLVWVVDPGVWPSSENLSLYYCWRRAVGINTPLEDAPGHVFLPFERDEMISLVQMSVIFGWGIVCVSSNGDAAFSIDDDGDIAAFGDTADRAASLAAGLPAV